MNASDTKPQKARRRMTNPSGTGGRHMPVRILCVDDHELLVEGLKAQCEVSGRASIVASLTRADTLVETVEEVKPAVALLEIEMPGVDVFEAADRLHHMSPETKIVFLSAHIRDGYIASAYACGANGYFCKSDDPAQIIEGVCDVAHSTTGEFVMSPMVRERCLGGGGGVGSPASQAPDQKPGVALRLGELTAREIEVLRLIGKGLSRGEIAKELHRSAKTIDGHQERMMRKLHIDSRAELMRYAIREGFAEA